jgi:hypothetical protein
VRKPGLCIQLILSLVLCFHGFSHAQFSEKFGRYDSIPTTDALGDTMENAWAGGFNAAQFSSLDLNLDGRQDLLVFERDGSLIRTFLNNGSQSGKAYEYAPMFEHFIPEGLFGFVVTYDYNRDGKMDIFTAHPFGIALHKNVSDTNLAFEQVCDFIAPDSSEVCYMTMEYNPPWGKARTNVFAYVDDLPAIGDFNADGAFDVVSFGVFGSFAEYYENRATDPEEIDLVLRTQCWGVFSESGSDNSINLNSYCADSGGTFLTGVDQNQPLRSAARHVGSALLPIDLDQDQDLDLLISDVSFSNTKALHNGGDTGKAIITSVTQDYPPTDPVDISIFPGSFYLDVNNDGVKDLLSSPNAVGASIDVDNVWMYENSGQNDSPNFSFQTENFLSSGMVDHGSMANAQFVDVNGDSLLDVVVGNLGRFSGGTYKSQLLYLRNTGVYTDTSSWPSFQLMDQDYMYFGADSSNQGLAPAFGDLDGDGDMDMVLAEVFGNTRYYENVASQASDSVRWQRSNVGWDSSIFVGYNPSLTLYDLDDDGDLDLISGGRYGLMKFFENIGSSNNPVFSSNNMQDTLGGVIIQNLIGEGFTSPVFAKLDTNLAYSDEPSAQTYMLVGSEDGRIYVYDQIDGNLSGNFRGIDTMKVNAKNLRLGAGDLSRDGKLDLVFAQNSGGLSFILQDRGFKLPAPPVSVEESVPIEVKLYPNPASTEITLEANRALLGVEVYDLQGKKFTEVHFDEVEGFRRKANISMLQNGIHIVRMRFAEEVILKKFFKLPSHETSN